MIAPTTEAPPRLRLVHPAPEPGGLYLYLNHKHAYEYLPGSLWSYGPCPRCGAKTLHCLLDGQPPNPVPDLLCDACDWDGDQPAPPSLLARLKTRAARALLLGATRLDCLRLQLPDVRWLLDSYTRHWLWDVARVLARASNLRNARTLLIMMLLIAPWEPTRIARCTTLLDWMQTVRPDVG